MNKIHPYLLNSIDCWNELLEWVFVAQIVNVSGVLYIPSTQQTGTATASSHNRSQQPAVFHLSIMGSLTKYFHAFVCILLQEALSEHFLYIHVFSLGESP